MSKKIRIITEYITLGQLLKFAGIVRCGSDAKEFLMVNEIKVNGEIDQRRGRKLYKGFKVVIKQVEYEII